LATREASIKTISPTEVSGNSSKPLTCRGTAPHRQSIPNADRMVSGCRHVGCRLLQSRRVGETSRIP
jgi:hypothetical protein